MLSNTLGQPPSVPLRHRPLLSSAACSSLVMPYQTASGMANGSPAASLLRPTPPFTSSWSMPALSPSGRSTPLSGQFSGASGSHEAGGAAVASAVGMVGSVV